MLCCSVMQAICGNLISVSKAAWSWITALCGSSINMAYQVVKSNTSISFFSNSWSAMALISSDFNADLLCALKIRCQGGPKSLVQKRVAYKTNIARSINSLLLQFPCAALIYQSLSLTLYKSPSFFRQTSLPTLIDYYFHPRRVFAGGKKFNLVGCFLRALLPLSTHWPAAFELNFL